MSVYLPRWATDVVRRRRRVEAGRAMVLWRMVHRVETVAAVCAQAERAGVRVGMTVSQARALLPGRGAVVEELDEAGVGRALRRLAGWMLRFVPVAACDGSDGLLCDVTGCELLYGGMERLAARVSERVGGLGVSVRVAAGPTYGSAWALARWGARAGMVVGAGEVRGALGELPIESLRIGEAACEGLRRVGIERVGQLGALPRAAVADRYGREVWLRFDQAMGAAAETIAGERVVEEIAAERVFEGPTDRVESVMLASREALWEVCDLLGRRESGARVIEAVLSRSDESPLRVVVRSSRATREAKHLWSMLRVRLESAHLGFGVEGVRVRASGVARVRHEQRGAWGGGGAWEGREADRGVEGVSRLVDAYVARCGAGRVFRMHVRESHVPERSWWGEPVTGLEEEGGEEAALPEGARPGVVYSPARRAVVELGGVEGPVVSVSVGGEVERVVGSVGPERVEGEWWRGGGASRDYHVVMTERGRVLWLVREGVEWGVAGVWV